MSTEFVTHALRALDPPVRSNPGTVLASLRQKDAPADLGTAEVGSLPRYWTVKFERGGRSYYDYVEACDAWKASLVVFKRQQGATSTQVVREIDRHEFEHLTRASP